MCCLAPTHQSSGRLGVFSKVENPGLTTFLLAVRDTAHILALTDSFMVSHVLSCIRSGPPPWNSPEAVCVESQGSCHQIVTWIWSSSSSSKDFYLRVAGPLFLYTDRWLVLFTLFSSCSCFHLGHALGESFMVVTELPSGCWRGSGMSPSTRGMPDRPLKGHWAPKFPSHVWVLL